MGKPSDKKRQAKRLGKNERTRRNRKHRSQMWSNVPCVGSIHLKAGLKKYNKIYAVWQKFCENSHLGGEPITMKSGCVKQTTRL